jgi:CheY-like chemotaxis protein
LAGTAALALEFAAKERFDIVLSDLGLPDSSGHQLMRQLKQMYDLKGIALSGYGMVEDLHRSDAAGFADHVVKPVNYAKLEAALQHVMSVTSNDD